MSNMTTAEVEKRLKLRAELIRNLTVKRVQLHATLEQYLDMRERTVPSSDYRAGLIQLSINHIDEGLRNIPSFGTRV